MCYLMWKKPVVLCYILAMSAGGTALLLVLLNAKPHGQTISPLQTWEITVVFPAAIGFEVLCLDEFRVV